MLVGGACWGGGAEGARHSPVRQERCRIGEKEDKAEARRMWRKTAQVGAVGLEMGFAVAIGYLGGSYLDTLFDTAPYIGLAGLLAGVGAAGKALWNTARKLKDDQTQ